MLRKSLFYLPKFLLSRWYAWQLKRGNLDPERFIALVSGIKKQLLSPKRNGFPDLAKRAVAAYYVRPGDSVIDVGAHIGSYTAFYADLVGDKGEVYSYEAHPLIFKRLQARFQGVSQVILKNFAVSNRRDGKIQMKIYPDEVMPECATVEKALMHEGRMPGKTALVDVSTQSLDLLSDRSIRLIKIDVEGHEHAVIDGARSLLKKQKPVLLFEYGYIPGQFEPKTIAQIETLGYVAYDCTTLKKVAPDYIALSPTDLVAVPKEKEAELAELFSVLL